MRKIKVFHTCRICEKHIETKWNGTKLDGEYMQDDVMWSEVLEHEVAFPDMILCKMCFIFRSNSRS